MGNFYSDKKYTMLQSIKTKKNWSKGKYDFLKKRVSKKCRRKRCSKSFETIPSDPKQYCSRSCAATVNNKRRGGLSEETKRKISRANSGRVYLKRRGKTFYQYRCKNPACGEIFSREPWKKPKYCSNKCSIKTIGAKRTSPKAARGKAGVRSDISEDIYFYSRWEANVARFYNFRGIKWTYSPRSFDLGGQNYTPDFYLPEDDKYIEVKNFWGEYSRRRHKKFLQKYPHIDIEVILKDDYLKLEEKYSQSIPGWEYSR